jgi:serine protease Do
MYKARYLHSIRRWSQKAQIAGIVWIICTCLFATLGNAMTTYAAGVPGGNIANPVVRAVDIAEPAVVRIITSTSGQLIVHFSANNDVTFPQGSGKAYELQLSGSGTFISSKGDILTADHVVNPPAEALQQAAAQDVANYIDQNPKLGLGSITADQAAQALQSGQIQSSASYDTKTSQVFLSTSYTGPLTAQDLASVPSQYQATVDKIEKESAVDQEDTAIVHAPFNFDTPSVQLGDSSSVQQQDQLTIIGFPGNGDVSQKPTDLLTSSVNTISVSSIKSTDNGAPVIQVSGNVEHGDSGGPALDSNGEVVGIVSFGLASPGSSAGNTSFLQASNSARTLIQSLNLDTTPGQFQKLWSQAFTSYAANTRGHWHTAAQQFQLLATQYPQFQAVKPYLTYAQQQARTEVVTPAATATAPAKSKQPSSIIPSLSGGAFSSMALLIGGIVVVLLLALSLFAVIFRFGRRKKKPEPPKSQAPAQKQAPAQAPTPVPAAKLPPSAPPPAAAGNGMQAFGAPPAPGAARSQPVQPQQAPPRPQPGVPSGTFSTATLRVWPCGHMNRPNARFCSVCGEPAPTPPPTIKRVEQ